MVTFGKKIGVSFAITFLLLLIIGGVAYRNTELLVSTSKLVTHSQSVLEHISEVYSLLKDAETGQRGFLLTSRDSYLEPYLTATTALPQEVKALRDLTAGSPQEQLVDQAEPLINSKLDELHRTIEARRTTGSEAALKIVLTDEGKKYMDDLRRVFDKMENAEKDVRKKCSDQVDEAASTSRVTIALGTLLSLMAVIGMGIFLSRTLTTQIGAAVHHIQSSSAELQSAANQQVMGSRESSTSMSEIATTISELLATSRQIAESSQRVTGVAEQTASATRSGEDTVGKATASIEGIRRQMDRVVDHMLELGRKSQQIGSVLEIVSELAEQTNILAINATIEAVGAGEAGKRFAVVADEIRKLADRVTGSTKEIRGLIEDVRGAVNTTVMATETSSKAVDSGTREFAEVAVAFSKIANLILTTTDASREIGLSTKQQTTAVEQVNIAISNVAQAARETEASSTQTLETASQLASLSRELLRIVQPQS